MTDRYRKQKYESNKEMEKALYLLEDSLKDDKSKSSESKAFIKGGIIDPYSKESKDSQRGELYLPSSNKMKEEKKFTNAFEQTQSNRPASSSQAYAQSSSKQRNIDKIAQELKAKRQMETNVKPKAPEKMVQELTREITKLKGSNFSDSIPQKKETTQEKEFMESTEETAAIFKTIINNRTHVFSEKSHAYLAITNLPNNIQEGELKDILKSYGGLENFVLASLKPSQDQPPRLIAYVKYKNESDAQTAKEALKKRSIKGLTVTARWGQPHPNAKNIKTDLETFENKVYVQIPENNFIKRIIDKISKYVDGHIIEHAIMERERKNPEFSFLFVKESPEHNYYRWRVYSYANGDTDKDWRLEPFRIYEYGPLWYPPPSTESPETKKKQATGSIKLTDEKREELEDILRNLTTERRSISEAMAFCLDNADHSVEIVYTILESISNMESTITKKISRLYLINDILYNSSLLHVPGAWSYRKFFEAKLPDIFEELNKTKNSIRDSSVLETTKDKIMKVLRIWNDWNIYDLKYLLGLEATFTKKQNPFGAGSLRSHEKGDQENEKTNFIRESSEVGIKLRFIEDSLNSESTKNLEKLCRQNGLSTTGGRRGMIERILVLREYEMRNNKDEKAELGIQFETVEKKKVEVTPELIKDYNKLLSVKQSQNLGLHEIDKMISGGLELLRFIQSRNEKLNERDINGELLDDLDFTLYQLPRDDMGEEIFDEKNPPSGINLDGEPLTDSELRELERLERKQTGESYSSKRYKDDRSPRDRDRRKKSRERSLSRKKGKKYSKRYSSSSSSSRSSSSRSRSGSRSRSRSRSKSSPRKNSRRNQRRR